MDNLRMWRTSVFGQLVTLRETTRTPPSHAQHASRQKLRSSIAAGSRTGVIQLRRLSVPRHLLTSLLAQQCSAGTLRGGHRLFRAARRRNPRTGTHHGRQRVVLGGDDTSGIKRALG